jgi:hypothetical protein
VRDQAELVALRITYDAPRTTGLVDQGDLGSAEFEDAAGGGLDVRHVDVQLDAYRSFARSGTGWKTSLGAPAGGLCKATNRLVQEDET